MLERKKLKNRTLITFILPEDTPPGPVSVVGDFNHWNPDAHPLHPRGDGMRTVSISLPTNQTHAFRYLGNDESRVEVTDP
ncbi:hypothetical protein OV450_6043, partial [Actinobacteria bacterium OV450]